MQVQVLGSLNRCGVLKLDALLLWLCCDLACILTSREPCEAKLHFKNATTSIFFNLILMALLVQLQCHLASGLVTLSPYSSWLTIFESALRMPLSNSKQSQTSRFLPEINYLLGQYRTKLNEHRVTSLSNVLRDIERVRSEQVLTDWQTKALANQLEECHNVLITLGEVVDKNYLMKSSNAHGFRDKSRRAWKRLTWMPDDIQELRARVTLNIALLSAFNGSLTRCLSRTPNKILLAG